jgi:competence protein ComGC
MSKSSNNRDRLNSILIVALLLIVVNSISKQKKEKQNTVIEANHFFSSNSKTAVYNIEKVESGKPLILLLKDSENESSRIKNPVSIKLESG